jgi:hypothetical protein
MQNKIFAPNPPLNHGISEKLGLLLMTGQYIGLPYRF